MVQTWSGEMRGARLGLLLAMQVCIMRWSSFIQAENLPYNPDIDTEFQIFEASKLHNKKATNGMLVFEDSKDLDSDIARIDGSVFVDALWTAKPKLGNYKGYKNHNQNFKTKNHTANRYGNRNKKVNYDIAKEKSAVKLRYEDETSAIDAPPLFDEPDRPEIETTPYVTESVTQPITTEMDFEATTDEDEMLRRMHRRWRRAVIQVTVTTPEPSSTTAREDDCDGDSYYDPEDDNCSCPRGKTQKNCDEDMDTDQEDDQDRSTNTFSGLAVGPYDNGERAQFENEIWKLLKTIIPGFKRSRVYVHPITYNAETGYSTITFDIINDENLSALDTWRLSSVIAEITSNRTPLNINGQQVLWLETANLTITEDDGTIKSVPVSADQTTQICYIFDQLGTCKNGGICVNNTGEPVCSCTTDYHGKYCEARIQRLGEEEDLLAILIPVLAGLSGLVFLCSCCFLFARRANKGDEASSVSSVPPAAVAVPKLFFHDTNWKHFDRGPRLYVEEIWEERPVVEYERAVIEEVYEPDQIVREPIYKYYVDTEEVSVSSTESESGSESSATRGSWIEDASRIGSSFHIDRPECSSSANSAYF